MISHIYKKITGFAWRILPRPMWFLSRVKQVVQQKRISSVVKRILQSYVNRFKVLAHHRENMKILNALFSTSTMPIIIYPPFHDWNLPLYQRPQHLAIHLAQQGFKYLFLTNNHLDNIDCIQMRGNMTIIPPAYYHFCLNKRTKAKKILFLYSHPAKLWDMTLVEQTIEQGNLVIYDYLDELNDEIFGTVDPAAKKRHEDILKNEKVICLVTAQRLWEDAIACRQSNKNIYSVPNATALNHFGFPKSKVEKLEALKPRKVIGYFGALAAWVDYELIIKMATEFPDSIILLVGFIYDKNISKYHLEKYSNIIMTGAISYDALPDYAHYFDVSIIPFRVNETTIATSPIKLFEYMALGKPIVTSAMPECMKYRSAMIGHTHDEFIELIRYGLTLSKDDPYFDILRQESQANTWESRAQLIKEVIEQSFY